MTSRREQTVKYRNGHKIAEGVEVLDLRPASDAPDGLPDGTAWQGTWMRDGEAVTVYAVSSGGSLPTTDWFFIPADSGTPSEDDDTEE